MPTLSGFWAGVYKYPDPNFPEITFDCELVQAGSGITGHTTEIDIYKRSALFVLESMVEGQVHKRDICLTKTYLNASDIYDEAVEYVGKVSLSGHRISGRWYIGDYSGTFGLKRDKGSLGRAKSLVIANDVSIHSNL